VNRTQPPSLTFANTAVGQTSSDSPQSVAMQNIGNQPLHAVSPGLASTGPNFIQVAGSGTPADCGAGFSAAPLAPGAICNVSISFEPQMAGNPLTSTAVFTDNALNANPSASQAINLQGVGTLEPQTIAFTLPPTETALTSVTLVATATSNLPVTLTSSTPSVCSVTGTTAQFLMAVPVPSLPLNPAMPLIRRRHR